MGSAIASGRAKRAPMIMIEQVRRYSPRLADALQARVALVRKAISFGLIGVVNTFVDFGVFMFGVKVLGLPLVFANLLSWIVAVTGSYILNSHITFAAESGRRLTWRSYATYAASGIAGLIANTATVVAVAALLRPVFFEASVPIAKVSAIGVSFIVNFSMSHFIVFRRRPDSELVSQDVRPTSPTINRVS
jgi:putative flippase GtrA